MEDYQTQDTAKQSEPQPESNSEPQYSDGDTQSPDSASLYLKGGQLLLALTGVLLSVFL